MTGAGAEQALIARIRIKIQEKFFIVFAFYVLKVYRFHKLYSVNLRYGKANRAYVYENGLAVFINIDTLHNPSII